jgi:hypothetical protein
MAGCTIILVAVASMVFLVGFVIWNLFKLESEIAKFTAETPRPVPTPDLVANVSALNNLKAELEIFHRAQKKNEPASLALSAGQINLAIAAFDHLKELRGAFHVDAIRDGKMHITISYPMNGRPMSGNLRYLNGSLVALPELAGGEVILRIEKIEVVDATVPDGFLGQMSPHRITEVYREDKILGPIMASLTGAGIEGDRFVLSVTPGETPPQAAPESLRPFVTRSLLLFGLIVLVFLAVLLGAKRVARRRRAS